MPQEILINTLPCETRIALVKEGVLTECYIEKKNQHSLVGHIFRGRVLRVISSIQAAFVDIGLPRAGFLHVKDICVIPGAGKNPGREQENDFPDIETLLHPGQMILVQVSKDTFSTKGVRLTTYFSLPARYLVLTPNQPEIAISQKISDPNEQSRLRQLFQVENNNGYIFRTAAEKISNDLLTREKNYLDQTWQTIIAQAKTAKVGEIIYSEMAAELRVLRDWITFDTECIRVDDEAAFLRMKQFLETMLPDFSERLLLHTSLLPIFDLYETDKALQRALQRTVYMKSNGYLVFDQTEAMTTIDVNTGSSLGQKFQSEFALQTNLEAVKAIAGQVRLRNLGGIIIIDFIDMDDREHQNLLLSTLKNAFLDDPARTEFSDVTRFGLVQMTRKRSRKSLLDSVCEPCPTCQCRGMIKSIETIACEVIRAAQRAIESHPWQAIGLYVAPEVAYFIQNEAPEMILTLATRSGRQVKLGGDGRYKRDQYDVLPLAEG
ncbi:MAG: Rne/Rng family ribonuclease [Gammaproteobacteria bacterium]|nr:Rne/Rng family ribonuclease [Gammaproteobacteria bacterium]